jgi:hypothetical protein
MSDTTDDPYQFLATFQTREVDRLLERLEKDTVDYEIDMDDSQIRGLSPFQASMGGTYGTGVNVNLYVHEKDMERASQIIRELFPETKLP